MEEIAGDEDDKDMRKERESMLGELQEMMENSFRKQNNNLGSTGERGRGQSLGNALKCNGVCLH